MGTEAKVCGLIGFGEMGQRLAAGLVPRGIACFAWVRNPGKARPFARELGVELVQSPAALSAAASTLLSCVWPAAAEEVARSFAVHLHEGHHYVDLNNISVTTTRRIATVVETKGAAFSKLAVLSSIARDPGRVPIFAGGVQAGSIAALLREAGYPVRAVSDDPRSAAAVKILRSIVLKGLSALTLEALAAAERYGVREEVLGLLAESLDRQPFRERTESLPRVARHALRRSQELIEAAETVEASGLPAPMARAGAGVLRDLAKFWTFCSEVPSPAPGMTWDAAAVLQGYAGVAGSSAIRGSNGKE